MQFLLPPGIYSMQVHTFFKTVQVFEITAARLRTVGSGIHFNKQTSDDCQGHRIKTIVG